MDKRELLKGLLSGNPKAMNQLAKSKPPIHATLQVVAPDDYQAQPGDEVALCGTGERMTVEDWHNLNTNASSPPILSTFGVEGAIFITPKPLNYEQ